VIWFSYRCVYLLLTWPLWFCPIKAAEAWSLLRTRSLFVTIYKLGTVFSFKISYLMAVSHHLSKLFAPMIRPLIMGKNTVLCVDIQSRDWGLYAHTDGSRCRWPDFDLIIEEWDKALNGSWGMPGTRKMPSPCFFFDFSVDSLMLWGDRRPTWLGGRCTLGGGGGAYIRRSLCKFGTVFLSVTSLRPGSGLWSEPGLWSFWSKMNFLNFQYFAIKVISKCRSWSCTLKYPFVRETVKAASRYS